MKSNPSTTLRPNGDHETGTAIRQSERMKLEEAFLLQKQLLETRDYAEAVVEAVPPLLVLDQKLRVHTANESFCKHFKIKVERTVVFNEVDIDNQGMMKHELAKTTSIGRERS